MLVQLHKYGISPSFWGAIKHTFCFEMLLKVSDMVSWAHLLPLKFSHKGQRHMSFCGTVFSETFPFPPSPHHSIIKSIYLCLHHFLVMTFQFQTLQFSKIAVLLPQISILHQGTSYLYFRYQVEMMRWEGQKSGVASIWSWNTTPGDGSTWNSASSACPPCNSPSPWPLFHIILLGLEYF